MSTKPLNVNEDEIAKFEQVASQWWDLAGDFKPLHQVNPLRVQFISQHIAQHYDAKNSGFCDKKIIARNFQNLMFSRKILVENLFSLYFPLFGPVFVEK